MIEGIFGACEFKHHANKGKVKKVLSVLREYKETAKAIGVNPAYSSQECSSCGYVDKENRKSTQEFKCKCCGNKINAQVNGAKNTLKRSSLGSLYLTKKQILKVLIKKHLERLKGVQECSLGRSQEKSLLQGVS